MVRNAKGFTLIELMIVVVIIGILAAIAIPNFIAMQSRAKEGSTKANMHTFQLAAEDYGVQQDGMYSTTAIGLEPMLPNAGANYKNPFNSAVASFVDQGTWAFPTIATGTTVAGTTVYGDSAALKYQIRGVGKSADLALVLSSGQ